MSTLSGVKGRAFKGVDKDVLAEGNPPIDREEIELMRGFVDQSVTDLDEAMAEYWRWRHEPYKTIPDEAEPFDGIDMAHLAKEWAMTAEKTKLADRTSMDMSRIFYPREPREIRIPTDLTPKTRKGITFSTEVQVFAFNRVLRNIRSCLDFNPPDGLIGAEWDPDPVTRNFTRREMVKVAVNRLESNAINPPPFKKRFEIHGIKGDVWMEAAECLAGKINRKDESVQIDVTQVPLRSWNSHLGVQSLRQVGNNVPFESGSSVYVSHNHPNTFGVMDSLGGSWELGEYVMKNYAIDPNPCFKSINARKTAVLTNMKMRE